jgi:AcrR family transcriptional regulator
MTSTATRRARDDAAKASRREFILDVVEALFAGQAYESITMSAVAARCGLAKGTLYLYFPTREAMFLGLYLRHATSFAGDLVNLAVGSSPDDLARDIADALASRPMLLKLMGLVPTVFERNVTPDVAAAFKHDLLAALAAPAAALAAGLPILRGDGLKFLIRLSALAVGLADMAYPSPVIAEILDRDPALRPFRVDFRQEFAGAVAALLRGWR